MRANGRFLKEECEGSDADKIIKREKGLKNVFEENFNFFKA